MRRFPITIEDGKVHVGNFPDAVKVIAVYPLIEHLPRQYADMVLHHSDLSFARECLATLATEQVTSPVIAEALWQCAIVHYCKCFGKQGETRARLPYSKIFPAGLPREIHNYFMNLRNKHLIHDENAWTQATPMAVLADRNKEKKIEEVVCTNITAVTREAINFQNLNSLITLALPWVESRIDELCEKIKVALETHEYEVLLAQPEPDPYYAAKAEDVSKPRHTISDHRAGRRRSGPPSKAQSQRGSE